MTAPDGVPHPPSSFTLVLFHDSGEIRSLELCALLYMKSERSKIDRRDLLLSLYQVMNSTHQLATDSGER
jgi:hypothetical protein